jgi:hypothetical protein
MEIGSEISTKDNIVAKILHCKAQHPEILSAYSKIVGFPSKQRNPFEAEHERGDEPETGEFMEHQRGTPNPEQCTKTKEELSSEILRDPRLRAELIKKWIQSQKRSD